jgi:hypothetical protein
MKTAKERILNILDWIKLFIEIILAIVLAILILPFIGFFWNEEEHNEHL